MAAAIQIARICGIPLRIHYSLLLIFPLFAWHFAAGLGGDAGAWGLGGALAALLFASVALHELGHSLTALAMGVRVAEIMLLPIGGAARLDQMPRRFWQELLLAAAGPAVSLTLAAAGWRAADGVAQSWPRAGRVLTDLAWINLALGLFNLLPAFPMDGGRMLRALLTPWLGRLGATRLAARLGQALALVFGLIGAYPPFNPVLVAIAFFVYAAAAAEYRQVLRETLGPPPMDSQ